MNLFALSSILVVISNLLCACFLIIFFKRSNRKLNLIWIFLCIAVSIWGWGGFKFSTDLTKEGAYFWWQIAHIGIIFVPIIYYHFVFSFLRLDRKYQQCLLYVGYLASLLFIILSFHPQKIFIGELKFVFGQYYLHYWPMLTNKIYLVFYLSFYWLLLAYSFSLLIINYRHSKGIVRNQIRYFLFTSIIGWIGPHGDYLPVFGIETYPYSNFLIAIYPVIMTYAIIKYRLLDIRLALTRATLFIAVYTLVLGFPFAVATFLRDPLIHALGANWWIFPLVLMGLSATIGPGIYIYLGSKAEGALLRDQKRYQNTLRQASIGIARIRNLKRLLELIAHIITKTVKITYVAIYLYDPNTDGYVLQVSRGNGRIPVPKLRADNPLIKWIIGKRKPLIYEEVKRRMEGSNEELYRTLEENMRLLTASVVIPSLLEKKPMGFIVLGDKMSGQVYTVDDLNVFQVLASQAALAIENAKFIEEAKEMQAQIAQAEKMAIIGTMADDVSDQVNDRFYALSLIAGDSIDTIKYTEIENCAPEISEMLGQISHALEYIQTNVGQGNEVVEGILKHTRKEETLFEPFPMADLWLHLHTAVSLLNCMDLKGAEARIQEIAPMLEQLPSWARSLYHGQRARMLLIRKDLEHALYEIKRALYFSKKAMNRLIHANGQVIFAQICNKMGRNKEAVQYLDHARHIIVQTDCRSHLALVWLLEAQFAFEQGDDHGGLELLRKAFIMAREGGYVFGLLDDPTATIRMCERALEEGIEVEHVRTIIRRRGLVPDKPPIHIEDWPWAVKIYTLGRFSLVRNDEMVEFSRKAQQKPLALLKALIALGGRGIKEEKLSEILWPDADGDMAHQSFDTTLYRLRKLLGRPEALIVRDGRVTLDNRYCWVDVWAFERLLGQADELRKQGETNRARQSTEKAIVLYRGHFLAGECNDPWIVTPTERMKSSFFKSASWLGRYLGEAGDWEQAAEYYERFLQLDECREDFYRLLMVCYDNLGRKSDALSVYQRCRRTLSSLHGMMPSPETETVRGSIFSEKIP